MVEESRPLAGKVALLVGGTKGIGRATALKLACLGATVVVVGRDRVAGERTRQEIEGHGGVGMFIAADVSLLSEVRRLATKVQARYERLHLLIHTADVFRIKRADTPEGLEVSFAVNYLSRFLLNQLLLDLLVSGAPARSLHVSAAGIPGRLDLRDVPPRATVSSFRGHNLGQRANDVYCVEMAARLTGTGVTINALMPGFVDTGLRRQFRSQHVLFAVSEVLTRPWVQTPEQFAERILHWATAPETATVSGQLIGMRGRPIRLPARVTDRALRRGLFERSERLIARHPLLPRKCPT
jgi:NAD(P)-dependent dehydrogenase (short-subunit alcohol dehydrogenase family)